MRSRLARVSCPLRGPAQVRSDCPPPRLLAFLVGEAGAVANEVAEAVMTSKAEEEALLEQVRADRGPCRVCARVYAGEVIARKLSKHARSAVRQPSASEDVPDDITRPDLSDLQCLL